MQQLSKRYPRVERDESIEVHDDENAHLWAISYADFLMALLSFFILFFSMDENGQGKIMLLLTKEFSQSGAQISQKLDGNTDSSLKKVKTSLLVNALKDFQLQVKSDDQSLTIDFPENIFERGGYKIAKEDSALLKKVLEKLLPYQNQIKISFEGHTDDTPSQRRVQSLVVDNFLLSSLRASTTLFKARELGFDEKQLFIQASSSHARNSRSVSIHVFVNAEGSP